MPLTVRQDSRRNTATALSAMFLASHAQVSSNRYVHFAPGRAHGTCATSTPCSGHRTRGAAASKNVRVVPVSTVRHRLVPAPESYPGHRRRHVPHRPADRASGRTATTRISPSQSRSASIVTSPMTMPWTPNSCPNTLALRMPCSPPSFRFFSKTKTTAEHGMSHQTRRSGTHYNVTRASAHPLKSCDLGSHGHFVLQDGNSHRRHYVADPVSGRHTTSVLRPRDRSTWEVPFLVAVMTPTNRHGTQRASASPVTVPPAVNGIRRGVNTRAVASGVYRQAPRVSYTTFPPSKLLDIVLNQAFPRQL